MAMTKPPFVPAGIVGAPLTYYWDDRLEVGFFADKDQNNRLYVAIDRIAFRAKFVLGLAIAEWIVWRFDGTADTKDLLQRLEAARPTVLTSRYTKDLMIELYDTPKISSEPSVNGPLRLVLTFIGQIHRGYSAGYIYMTEAIVRTAVLARHVLPGEAKKDFDIWLKESIRQAMSVYPPQSPYDKTTERYIATGEEPVPMELFDPQWNYTPERAKEALRALLKSLDPKSNPYLRTPSEMKDVGFSGTPYQL